MPETDTTTMKPGDAPITANGLIKWQGVLVGLLSSAFMAGVIYMAAKADIAKATETSNVANAKVVELERKVARIDTLEAQQRTMVEKVDRILRGVESMDDKLFAMVCSKDPSKCDKYERSVPR